ncbi:uncharacterized protein BHQ10_006575 [Talaromyces amestolkiae]|uniref:Uncharacterized protein n=1 Tax=Talaromyces amestolkiae TaxID=1196081 RepID=A0A364L461_TALAM|nr:uncharacterized protein BHQ10_006575 [Talaromyces amestolkiae]RAO70563.1 hypothetical protein BHQ10_006575 [Talaromyces amestolkiae]
MVARTFPRLAGNERVVVRHDVQSWDIEGTFVARENRVPYYQRLFQQHDGKRQWWKTGRSGALLWPYYISLWGTTAITTYAMIRLTLGHKTFFGKE